MLTAIGNSIILLGAAAIYAFEYKAEKNFPLFIDCITMSAGLVTTVGYANFTASTDMGKLTVVALMLLGTLFVWSYMGFLVTGLIAPELSGLEKDVHDVEKELKELKLGEKISKSGESPVSPS